MSDRILVGTRKGLFQLDRVADSRPCRWEIRAAAFLGDNVSMVLPDARDGTLFAALDHGHFGCKMQRSCDGGQSWQECAVPTYPPQPEEEQPPNAMGGKPAPWNLELVWALESGGRDEPGVLWAGTIPGGLFRSADAGDTWELNRALWDEPRRRLWFGGGYDHPGIHSICVDPSDSRHVIVGVSCGGVWETRDGGGTWECRATGMKADYMPPERMYDPEIQDPHRVVQCPNNLNCLWAQHHNGIFRTVDGCASWQQIDGVPLSSFGFAVAVHPHDPATAWFVPGVKDEHRIPVDGRVAVTRTRDGGASFDVLTEGLPGPHAYDLVFRHALDVDESGERLVFGSTTGSLWISENQGDLWHCISEHLPPIYCTRFVK